MLILKQKQLPQGKGLGIIVERCGEHCKMLHFHHGYNKCFAKFFQAKLLFVARLFEIVMLALWF